MDEDVQASLGIGHIIVPDPVMSVVGGHSAAMVLCTSESDILLGEDRCQFFLDDLHHVPRSFEK